MEFGSAKIGDAHIHRNLGHQTKTWANDPICGSARISQLIGQPMYQYKANKAPRTITALFSTRLTSALKIR